MLFNVLAGNYAGRRANLNFEQDAGTGQGGQADPTPAAPLYANSPGMGDPNATPAPTPVAPADPAPAAPAAPVEPTPPATPELTGAPEKYADFNFGEGVKADPALVESFVNDIAKPLNLTQDQAQKLVDYDLARNKAAQEQHVQTIKGWETQSKTELGEQGIENATKAFNGLFGDKPEVKAFLEQSGLNAHPAFNKMFATLWEDIKTAPWKDGQLQGGAKPTYPGQGAYPSMSGKDKQQL